MQIEVPFGTFWGATKNMGCQKRCQNHVIWGAIRHLTGCQNEHRVPILGGAICHLQTQVPSGTLQGVIFWTSIWLPYWCQLAPLVLTKQYVANELSISHRAHLLWSRANDFYRTKRFTFRRIGSRLHIQILFPVTYVHDETRLYRVHTFPLAVPNNTLTTLLTGVPKYFMTIDSFARQRRAKLDPLSHQPDGYFEYYIELEHMPALDDDNYLDLTDMEATFRPRTHDTCLSLIFRDAVNDVNNKCSFHAIPGPLEPATQPLTRHLIIMQNIPSYELSCWDTDGPYVRQLSRCIDTSFVHLPCRCALLTAVAFIPERLTVYLTLIWLRFTLIQCILHISIRISGILF
jgi:hypothetical protein